MTHWKKLTNPDYLGAYALGKGEEVIATIKTVGTELVVGTDGVKSECIVAHFEERDIKPMILNATNCKTISKLSGSAFVEEWSGIKIQIYAAKVRAFGETVDALRIRPTPPKKTDQVPPCEECGGQLKAAWNMTPAQLVEYTKKNTGAVLCASCARKRKEAMANEVDA